MLLDNKALWLLLEALDNVVKYDTCALYQYICTCIRLGHLRVAAYGSHMHIHGYLLSVVHACVHIHAHTPRTHIYIHTSCLSTVVEVKAARTRSRSRRNREDTISGELQHDKF